MTSKNKLSTKIIMMVECILLISGILFCTISVYRGRISIRKAIQQRMLDIANCASGSVNGNILKSLNKDTVGSPEYNDIYSTLAVFRDNVELEYVYSIKKDDNGDFIFTMDLDPVTPASYGDSVKYTDALASAGEGKAAVDEVPYSDAWGEFYSAYSPVFDSEGNVAGIIAVDFSADWFEGQLISQTRSTIIVHVILLILMLSVAAFLSLITVRPFVRYQEKLLEEKVRAESANNAKSEFLANMSHEIRTPINAVLGMNEMILRENERARKLTENDRESAREAMKNISIYAGDVKQAGKNLLAIVNDILDFSRIEAGRLVITEAPYGLSSLLNDLNNMFVFKAQEKGLAFSIEVDETLPDELCGDEVRIRQILTNVLNNAIKYTEKGSVRLTVSGQKQDNNILHLTAAIQDTGIGIRSEDIDKLFTKFQRLEMEHNSTLEGTGLGLAITQRLLTIQGGDITVDSEYGKGSVFTVTIPQKIISDIPVGDLQSRFETYNLEPGEYHESFRAPNARILVVDDTKINLTVVTNLLKNTRIRIDTATGGAEAVAMAEKEYYDLILMDQRMPEMDGTKALHLIRDSAQGASRCAPIICLTANAVVGTKDRYLSEGFTDYLTKPVNSTSLEKALIRYLPNDKIEMAEEDTVAPTPSPVQAKKDYSGLNAVGIDPQTGLRYCQDDESFYLSLLAEFVHEKASKSENLQKHMTDGDWKNYSTHVHSLKSTSKMIGANELSQLAAKLEEAADNNDPDTIHSEHDHMMTDYENVVRAITAILPDKENTVEESEIFEFSPED